MSIADAIAAAIHDASGPVVAQQATVAAVGTGTVDVTVATGTIPKVRRLAAYSSPTVGDTVLIMTTLAGDWIALGSLA